MIDLVLERIRRYAKTQGYTKTGFALKAGLPDTTLRDFWRKTWSPRTSIIRRLEAVIPKSFK
jgi:hypothetical protein